MRSRLERVDGFGCKAGAWRTIRVLKLQCTRNTGIHISGEGYYLAITVSITSMPGSIYGMPKENDRDHL